MKHDDLADVRPLGVRIQISDGVHGMWMGKELAEIRNYGVPWTNETILNYFEDLVKFHDAWCESITAVLLPDIASELQALDLDNETFSKWKLVRTYVESAYTKYEDRSLLSILETLGVTPALWIQACTTGGVPKCFKVSDDFIDELEHYYMSRDKVVWVEMGKHFGLSAHIVSNLSRVFFARHKAKYGDLVGQRKYARELLNDLSLCTDETPTHIAKEVFDRTGVEFHISAVTKIRARSKQEGK